MASRDPSNGAFRIGSRGGEGSVRDRVTITVDGEALASLLARREQLQRMAEGHLSESLREQERLLQANGRLEEQVALLQERVATLSVELSLRRDEGPAASSGDKRPRQ